MVLEIEATYMKFALPAAVQDRLTYLLDKQNIEGKLSLTERAEAEGLVELAELLSLLNLRAKRKQLQ